MINIYTDGSCSKNPGPGGYAFAAFQDVETVKYCTKYKVNCVDDTTNNREELKAIIEALKWITENNITEPVTIHSDSAYCIGICTDWIYKWASNGWINSKKQEVENRDLVELLYYNYLNKDFLNCQINFKKVPGHSNILENEIVDALCTKNKRKLKKIMEDNPSIEWINPPIKDFNFN